ncbi:MAG TPA: histidine phosphatase family protein [Clostridiaceae bacterium]|nr:histidine phosphatase family protein [Clostridiaceae bacterium]
MTSLYFVRHAEPDHHFEEDRSRPLTAEGMKVSLKVTEVFREISIDAFYSSPYRRSHDTVKGCAALKGCTVNTDERLRERQSGQHGNNLEMFRKRWADFDFHEENGESLHTVQKRNIEAVGEILNKHKGEEVVIGTHGTALSTILNYYNPAFGCDEFLEIIDLMPYVIRLDFDGEYYTGREELLKIRKVFKGKK